MRAAMFGGVGEVAAEYREWLAGFLPAGYDGRDASYLEDWELRRDYQAALFEAGWLQPHWEPGLGGRGLTPVDSLAVRLEEASAGAPKLYALGSVHVAAPTLRAYGRPAQRDRMLVPALRGDERWCLGMSEPEAGSDLAGLRTRARIDGDELVIDGRKIWTSQAHWARWCLLYCRTDPGAPKHRGLSCVALDMTAPGVNVRPIRMADGGSEQFCVVELTDVRVPVSSLIGAPGDGWRIVTAALTDERDMLWLLNYQALLRTLRSVPEPAVDDPLLASAVGRSLADALAVRATGLRARAKTARGVASPEFLSLKLMCSHALGRAWDLSLAAAGARALAGHDLMIDELEALAATIFGGTSEVQRDIIGERALGLARFR
jgi:alkylation response protein AidB-like acyl-CoA dehydrogenase